MRVFLALYVIIAFAVPAHAATVVFSAERTGVNNIPAPPLPMYLQVRDLLNEVGRATIDDSVDGNDLADILEEDISLHRRDWMITEANAAQYGIDWTAFERSLTGPNKRMSLRLGAGGTGYERTGPSHLWLASDFELQQIDVTLHYWFYHPIFPELRAYSLESRVTGDGSFVPEPQAITLAIGATLAIAARRKRIYR
jgi:hypothetical protein